MADEKPNTHISVKLEPKVEHDIKPVKVESLEIGSSVTQVNKVRKVRRKIRKVSTRKGTYSKVKRKTKVRRKRKTTRKTTKTTKGRRKRVRTSKPLVTGKALTPRARLAKKLGIERNRSLGIHSLPTIKKMTQENLNNKRVAAGISVLSIFGSELNSHGSVPLREDHPDLNADLSRVDDDSPLVDEQEDSYGPQLPPEDITSNGNVNNISNGNSIHSDNIDNAGANNHELVVDTKPQVQIVENQSDRSTSHSHKEKLKKSSEIEEGEIAEAEGDSKSKIRRCKHGKLIHKKHPDSSKSKRSSSKEKKEEPKLPLIKSIKKEPRDRDEDRSIENRVIRDRVRPYVPNRHETDRRLNRSPPDERSSKYRENDRNRENHFREDRHSDKRRHRSLSRDRIPSIPAPVTVTVPVPPPSLPIPPPSSNRSRSEYNSSKYRSSHKRDSSKNHRSPVKKESRRVSPHYEPYESTEIKRKYDHEEEEKSKAKKKKKKHKHKHGKYDDDNYNVMKNSKNPVPSESNNSKRVPANSIDKISTNSRHNDHHHKKSKHHSRDGRSPPSHKISSPHANERAEEPSMSRTKSKRSRHLSPTREHISNRNSHKEERKDSTHPKGSKISSAVNHSIDEVNSKEIKVKTEDNQLKDHGNINLGAINNNDTDNNNPNSKANRSPSEVKSVSSKPGSPPKKDVRLVSKSRTEFDIFWDENSQNKKVDSSHQEYDANNVTGKEETVLRFLPRTLLSDQSSPSVCLPATVGPRTPPDEERTGKNVIMSSPDQTMPTPTQDESLEGEYSNGSPSKQRSSIKSLNSPSVDPDVYDPEAPLDSPEEDQQLQSEIARSQSKLNEMEKKSSPCAKQISPVKNVPRPETPELPSPRSPQHKFKSPNSFNSSIIPQISLTASSSINRVPTLAESSLPPAPGSLLAQIQQTLNLQTKTHSHSDCSKQLQSHPPHPPHQSHSTSTGLSAGTSTSSFIHSSSGTSANDSINKASVAPINSINALSPSLKSLLENLIKAAEQQQSKIKPFKTSVTSNANNIFKKPAPVLDSKSRSISHSHHHSVKTKVIDKEANKKTSSSNNQGIAPGSAPTGPKVTDVAVLDDLPSSAVELQVKEKYLKKLNRQERVVEEVKMVLKPFYQRKEISKEGYKEIMRKAVPKICHSKSGEINPQKVRFLVEGYIQRFKHDRKKNKTVKGK
ncbi:splicing factor, arginine/serine-rich 19 isoform X1 [Tetranychus urticae]|uniref:splicing factor, arginine/serine-rich 19 isoform X1 n=1 Tax=Tetranychus urticae TaxID=32264 RepID=UPI00077BC400|nr:splicing factor, arginine/serine-rich 19 isoform X1 [Tetranychus urticae]XP_015791930.1 splicing factor, arginine/serine-rich 19 isoform X1 [Tetranychus urticae]XP_025017925.1 splicing factor, arginine/serine-rich 19 isoform X1 [Tetranychus urticae]